MVDDAVVLGLLWEIEEGCSAHSCTPRDMSLDVEGDTLAALCRAWLAADGAPTVTLEWSDFNRGLFIDDSRATAFEWEQRLTGQRVRIVKEVGE